MYSFALDFRTLFTLQIVTAGNGILSMEVSVGLKTVITGFVLYFCHTSDINVDATITPTRNAITQNILCVRKSEKFVSK